MYMPCKTYEDDEQQMELPPGFRFHPTDEELISHYLSPKVLDSNFSARAIGEVDLNKVEPWDLPWRAKIGEKEWYFFCMRDRKYPTGLRTNRATEAGYWKATGKDKEIFKAKALVGMKKTLVFYKGRAPRGEKSNWVMHEYRLEGKQTLLNLPKSAKNEWVVCRIFKKSSGGKKIHISGLTRAANHGDPSRYPSLLPPLLDISSFEDQRKASYSSCFSDRVEDNRFVREIHFISPSSKASDLSNPSLVLQNPATPNSHIPSEMLPFFETLSQDQSIMKLLMDNDAANVKAEFSQDTGMSTDMSSPVSTNHEASLRPYEDQYYAMASSVAPVDIDCLWDY